jgi:YrbI family 3-deoxy-D-manno-octulosonate 8-phosphate phosphatase
MSDKTVKREVLALIPARGGSKSIPRKNIRTFAGHPLIAYSIAAGRQADLVTRVIVSTDDEEIAEVARSYGAEVPFLRPQEYAQDFSNDLEFFHHALKWLSANEGYLPEIVVQLRPTSPIRPKECVDQAIRLLLDNPQADSVRGVVPSGQNPYKMWQIDSDGRMKPLLQLEDLREPYNAPRQSLPPTYWQTGHIDAIWTSCIINKNSLSGDIILPLVLDTAYMVDIDTLNDWRRAEWLVTESDSEVRLNMVHPALKKRPLPKQVELVVFDFDGVMTDNRVWVDQDGREQVVVNRGDGMGLALLRQEGIRAVVLSTETNPVVAARCRKLDLPFVQAVEDKASRLQALLEEYGVDPTNAVYLGNDVNDTACFPMVGCAVVVADAHLDAARLADLVLKTAGGLGAVRELCDLLIARR